MSVRDELPVPEEAKPAPGALEMVRVWLANGQAQVSVRIGAWDEAAGYGRLLGDLAEHIADEYSARTGIGRRKVLDRIKEALGEELESPTDDPKGQILDDDVPDLGFH